MKCFCCLVLTQPFGVHGIPDAFSDGLGLSSFEKLLLLSPHFHLVEPFGFSIEDWSSNVVRVHPFWSCNGHQNEKQPQNWSGDQLKGVQGISKGDCGDPSAIAEHAEEEVTKATDCTNEAATKDVGFHQQPKIGED